MRLREEVSGGWWWCWGGWGGFDAGRKAAAAWENVCLGSSATKGERAVRS